jgi:hypothetical protein
MGYERCDSLAHDLAPQAGGAGVKFELGGGGLQPSLSTQVRLALALALALAL